MAHEPQPEVAAGFRKKQRVLPTANVDLFYESQFGLDCKLKLASESPCLC